MSSATFVTDEGLVVPGVTAAQMAEVDRIAMNESGPNLWQMMENAGRNLAEAVVDVLAGDPAGANVLVLAGTGGNGGGGMCAGPHLANRGARVRVMVTAVPTGVPGSQRRLMELAGGTVLDAGGSAVPGEPDVVVDAVIGYGLRATPQGAAAALIELAGSVSAPVVSLDVPSGLDATTGRSPSVCVAAFRTVTLALPKTGLDAPQTGELFVADLGIPRAVFRRAGIDVPVSLFAPSPIRRIGPAMDKVETGR